jgi:DNA repair protein RadC
MWLVQAPEVLPVDGGPSPAVAVTAERYSFHLPTVNTRAVLTRPDAQSSRRMAEMAIQLIGRELVECILVFFLDPRRRVIGFAEIARGTLNCARMVGRDVLRPALLVGADAVVLCHNHPCGDPSPSPADEDITVSLRAACDAVGITLLDHLVVTAKSWAAVEPRQYDRQDRGRARHRRELP